MANITTSGTTGYPGVVDTRTALTDGAAGDLIVANHPNGLGAAVLALENELGTDPAGSVADVKTRLAVALNNDGTVKTTVIAAGTGAAVAYSSGVFTIAFSGDGPSFIQNVGLSIDVNAPVANQMRINLRQSDGVSTPTVALPCRVAFRATTLTSGAYNIRLATIGTSLVISGGSTLGMSANEVGRIYVGLIDHSTVPELVAWNPKLSVASTTAGRVIQLFRPNEEQLLTTVAEGGAGTADSAGTLYSTTQRTGEPFRIIGYVDITAGTTAGNWSNNPSDMMLVGPGVRTTGDIVQMVGTATAVVRTGTTVAVNDGTTPLIGEGDPYMWVTMTSTNPVNPIQLSSIAAFSTSVTANRCVAHIHRNSESNALVTSVYNNVTNGILDTVSLFGVVSTTTAAAAGYYYIFGVTNANTTTFNGEVGASSFGPSLVSYFNVTEVCA